MDELRAGGRGTSDGGLSEPFHAANYEGLRLGDGFFRGGESFGVYPRGSKLISWLAEAHVVQQAIRIQRKRVFACTGACLGGADRGGRSGGLAANHDHVIVVRV